MKKNYKTIALLGISTVTGIHIINKLYYSYAKSKEILNKTENNYYDWRFGKVRYQKKGNGNPVLLIHDLDIGSSSYEFHKLADELAKANEVYTIDLLGYGLSEKPTFTYTNFLYVQLINDFIKNIIGKKTTIIASGESTSIAVMTCHTNPDLIKNLIFINPKNISKYNQIPSKRTKINKYIIETPIIGTFVYNLISNKEKITKTFKDDYYYDFSNSKLEEVYAYLEAAHLNDYNSKYTYASLVGRYMNINIYQALKNIDHSIMILFGKEYENAEIIKDGYISCNGAIETYDIDKSKKLPQLEKPEEVAEKCSIYLS
ncbi:MAG: alpha/beta hydrolase [Lachnospiraceae bacterium]|nr:alpha/beta hydrolase [Lachnospiraceae bacterium]